MASVQVHSVKWLLRYWFMQVLLFHTCYTMWQHRLVWCWLGELGNQLTIILKTLFCILQHPATKTYYIHIGHKKLFWKRFCGHNQGIIKVFVGVTTNSRMHFMCDSHNYSHTRRTLYDLNTIGDWRVKLPRTIKIETKTMPHNH